MIPIFDGHNDTLTRLRHTGVAPTTFLQSNDSGHLDLPRAKQGGMVGGLFAIFTRSGKWRPRQEPLLNEDGDVVPDGWSVPMAPRVERRHANRFTISILSDLFRLASASDGAIRVVRSPVDLERCIADGAFAAVAHVEGAEAIDTRLEMLDVLHAAGLRSLGLVWSRPNAFGHGVPFDFPGHPDVGPGLTPAGRRLVKRCNRLGILLDLSHLNAAGFWDVAKLSSAPLVASHSNAHALCASPRNLTDGQLDVIALSGGLVGINYAVGFLRSDGRRDADTPVDEIARHARYIADRIGPEHVALGSDFDGATIPADLGDAAGLQKVVDALRGAGFNEEEIGLIAYKNWVRVLKATWGG